MDNLVHFLDANYVPICQPIDSYSSVSYTKKWDEYGDFKFVTAPTLFKTVKDARRVRINGNTFMLDNIKTKDASANDEMSISGRTLQALLDKVVNSVPLRIRGNMEVQIRALVTSLAITGLQAVTKLALSTLHGYQNSIDIVVPRGSLGLWLYTTLNQRGFSYIIEYDQATDSVLFDIVQEVDRSNDQTVNEPVVFSAQKGNIENIEYSKSDTDACNFAIVYDDETGEIVYVDESDGEEKRSLIVQGKSANTASDDSLYVMIGADARTIYTSVDGNSFTLKATLAVGTTIIDVAYAAGFFIATGYLAGSTAIVLTSPDAVTWTQVGSRANCAFGLMTYNDGLMVITGRDTADSDDSLFTSYDGSTFSKKYLDGDDVTRPPVYIDGYWYCGAKNATTKAVIVYRSQFGFTWERKAFTAPSNEFGVPTLVSTSVFAKIGDSIVCFGKVDPAGADTGDILIVRSDDLFDTCTISTVNTPTYASDAIGVVFYNDVIVLPRSIGLSYSTDYGITFQDVTGSFLFISGTLCGHDGAGFYVYGRDDSTTDCYKAYSASGSSWSFTAIPSLPDNSIGGAYGSSTQIMSMGDIGRAALAEARSVEVIDGDILPNVSPIIGTDCNVGDITSVVDINRGIIATKRLVAAQTVIEGSAHYTIPKFGTDYLSLTKYIKKEIAKNV